IASQHCPARITLEVLEPIGSGAANAAPLASVLRPGARWRGSESPPASVPLHPLNLRRLDRNAARSSCWLGEILLKEGPDLTVIDVQLNPGAVLIRFLPFGLDEPSTGAQLVHEVQIVGVRGAVDVAVIVSAS